MPEQITKYPDITLQVLKGGGARCGEGVPQRILKQCPADRFCALPTGELCVYGIGDIPRMTQITPAEMAQQVCPGAAATGWGAELTALALAAGMAVGVSWNRFRRR